MVVHWFSDDAILVRQCGLSSEVCRRILIIFFEDLLGIGLASLTGERLQLIACVGWFGRRGALHHCL